MKTFEDYKEFQNLFIHQWDPQDLRCLNHNTPTSCSHRMVLMGFGNYTTNLGGGGKWERARLSPWQADPCRTSKYMIQQVIADWVDLSLYIYPVFRGTASRLIHQGKSLNVIFLDFIKALILSLIESFWIAQHTAG